MRQALGADPNARRGTPGWNGTMTGGVNSRHVTIDTGMDIPEGEVLSAIRLPSHLDVATVEVDGAEFVLDGTEERNGEVWFVWRPLESQEEPHEERMPPFQPGYYSSNGGSAMWPGAPDPKAERVEGDVFWVEHSGGLG